MAKREIAAVLAVKQGRTRLQAEVKETEENILLIICNFG